MHHEYSWCSMSTRDASWKLVMDHECSWCIRFVTKWHAMEVERISTRPISMNFRYASLRISRFSGFHILFFWMRIMLYCNLGASRDHQGSVWRQLGSPGSILEVFCVQMTFQEIQQSWTFDFWVFPVTAFDENQRNRCGIDARSFSNHPFISKTPDIPPQRPLC